MSFARRSDIKFTGQSLAVGALLIAAAGLVSRVAAATESDATAALAAAEQAYQQVDFKQVYDEASRALGLGNATLQQTGRLYVLLGISAAALGNDEQSKQFFVSALAVTPSLRLDNNLSPKFRGPYLEARGFWGAYQDRLSLRATTDAAGEHLNLSLEDPAHLAWQIRLYLRRIGSVTVARRVFKAAATNREPLAAELRRAGFEYYAQIIDEHGNTLYELGRSDEPLVVPAVAAAPKKVSVTDGLAVGKPAEHARSLWLPGLLAFGGLAATGAGVYFNVRRENEAHEWNGPTCEQPGLTRLEQCGQVNADRQNYERLAIGFYAGGGVLLVASVVTGLAGASHAPAREARPLAASRFSCQPGLSGLGLLCGGSF